MNRICLEKDKFAYLLVARLSSDTREIGLVCKIDLSGQQIGDFAGELNFVFGFPLSLT